MHPSIAAHLGDRLYNFHKTGLADDVAICVTVFFPALFCKFGDTVDQGFRNHVSCIMCYSSKLVTTFSTSACNRHVGIECLR